MYKDYVSPVIEVIEVSIEKGFASSHFSNSTEQLENIHGEWD